MTHARLTHRVGSGMSRPAQVARAGWSSPSVPYLLLLGCVGILMALGLMMVLAASSVTAYRLDGSAFAVADKQIMWAAIAIPLGACATRLRPAAYRRLAYPLLLGALGLLLLVQMTPLGREVNGSRNWLYLGSLSLQPSELTKLGFILWGADLITRKQGRLPDLRHLLVPLVPVGGLILGLVLVGGDLGTSIVLVTILTVLLFLGGAPGRVFLGFGAAVLVGIVAMIAVAPYRLARVTTLFHPTTDPSGTGYQALQGRFALADGGWWGVGLGQSRAKWGFLPEAHTDFIFAVIGEELGLVGSLGVLSLFALLVYAGFRVAWTSSDLFVRLAAGAATTWIGVQALVNLGGVIGLLPITGIPLPLLSYGGTALVVDVIALGMLVSFARPTPSCRGATTDGTNASESDRSV